MVKFSKELQAQLIPEWKESFVNYGVLKKPIKKIKLSKTSKPPQETEDGDFGVSIFDSICFFIKKVSNKFCNSDDKTDIIQVRKKSMENGEDVYVTDLSQLFSEEEEVKIFFETLDEELNKVNRFYRKQESELLERGETLNKHLQILLEINKIFNRCRRKNSSYSSTNSGNSPLWTSSPDRSSNFSESSIELAGSPTETSEIEEVIAALERKGVHFIDSGTRVKTKHGKPKMTMKIDNPATTTPTITSPTSLMWEDLVNNLKKGRSNELFNRKKVESAQKMIRGAFVELYKGLNLLKTYSSLNMVAFTKILKKFDKVSSQQASKIYLNEVKRSYFISSDKVVRLMDEVESIFTKHFVNNDRKKAMKFLRPHQRKASHMVTFFVGLFTGCFVSLFTVYAILAHICGIFTDDYLEPVYPIFSMFALLSLHLFVYGCNLFMWESTRINYNFILEFSPNTALTYRDAFLLCTTFMTIVVGAMVVHLLLGNSTLSHIPVYAIPGILLLFFFTLLIFPIDIFYRPTRYRFIRIIRNIVCSPFFKVAMVDFFMGDQLTSQMLLLRHMGTTTCYLLAGCFKTHKLETCKNGKLCKELGYVISFMPYYWRALQCARKWFDGSDVHQLANMGKYVSAMVAAGARLAYTGKEHHHGVWLAMVLVSSAVATVYQLYWDFVNDWGLLQPNSKNPWLRDDLILKNKSIYFMSIALNTVLRVAWLKTVLQHPTGVKRKLVDFLLASLEVIRRGHWNFYRLENEHLNNVGHYRAVKQVPLPFRETDSDG